MKFVREFIIFLALFGVIKFLLNSIGITSEIPLMICLGIGIFVLFGRNEDFFKKIGG
tara:strand:- start:941 stop:1111 length:171 start_codon:yes stop_codon:yes gene_type:complete